MARRLLRAPFCVAMTAAAASVSSSAATGAQGVHQRADSPNEQAKTTSIVLSLLKDLQQEAQAGIKLAGESSSWCMDATAQHDNLTGTLERHLQDAQATRREAASAEEKLKGELGATEQQVADTERQIGEVNSTAKTATIDFASEMKDLKDVKSSAEAALRLVKGQVRQGMREQFADGSDGTTVSSALVAKLMELRPSALLSTSERGVVTSFLSGSSTLNSTETLLEALGGITSRLQQRADTSAVERQSTKRKEDADAENLAFSAMVSHASATAIRAQMAQRKRERVKLDRTIADVSVLARAAQASRDAVAAVCSAQRQEASKVSEFIQAETSAVRAMLAQQRPTAKKASASPSFLQVKSEPQDDLAAALSSVEQAMASLPPESAAAAAAMSSTEQPQQQGQLQGAQQTSKGNNSAAADAPVKVGGVGNAAIQDSAAADSSSTSSVTSAKHASSQVDAQASVISSLCAAVERDVKADEASVEQAASRTARKAEGIKKALVELGQSTKYLDNQREALEKGLHEAEGLASRWAKYRKTSTRTLGAHAKKLVPVATDLLAEQKPAGQILQGLYQQLHTHKQALLQRSHHEGFAADPMSVVQITGSSLVQLLAQGVQRNGRQLLSLRAEDQLLSAISHAQLGGRQSASSQSRAAFGALCPSLTTTPTPMLVAPTKTADAAVRSAVAAQEETDAEAEEDELAAATVADDRNV